MAQEKLESIGEAEVVWNLIMKPDNPRTRSVLDLPNAGVVVKRRRCLLAFNVL